ncbi:MAG: hypothetical protein RLZZ210_189 [Pseudomonadota bacterium]
MLSKLINKIPYPIRNDFDNSSKFSRQTLKEYGESRNLTCLVQGAGLSGFTDALQAHKDGINSIILCEKRIKSEERENIVALTPETLEYLESLGVNTDNIPKFSINDDQSLCRPANSHHVGLIKIKHLQQIMHKACEKLNIIILNNSTAEIKKTKDSKRLVANVIDNSTNEIIVKECEPDLICLALGKQNQNYLKQFGIKLKTSYSPFQTKVAKLGFEKMPVLIFQLKAKNPENNNNKVCLHGDIHQYKLDDKANTTQLLAASIFHLHDIYQFNLQLPTGKIANQKIKDEITLKFVNKYLNKNYTSVDEIEQDFDFCLFDHKDDNKNGESSLNLNQANSAINPPKYTTILCENTIVNKAFAHCWCFIAIWCSWN